MQQLALDADLLPRVVQALGQSPLFTSIKADVLEKVAERGTLLQLEPEEIFVVEGTESDSFGVLLAGELSVNVRGRRDGDGGDLIEISKLLPPDSVGEMGLLLGQTRTATVKAVSRSLVMRFDRETFQVMYERVQGFGWGISRALAARLAQASRQIPMPDVDVVAFDAEVMALLPVEFLTRHRVVPVSQEGNRVKLGFVDDASARVLELARELLPGMDLVPVRVGAAVFERALASHAGVPGWTADPRNLAPPADAGLDDTLGSPPQKSSARLDALLRRMVAEGCSDLHLSGGRSRAGASTARCRSWPTPPCSASTR